MSQRLTLMPDAGMEIDTPNGKLVLTACQWTIEAGQIRMTLTGIISLAEATALQAVQQTAQEVAARPPAPPRPAAKPKRPLSLKARRFVTSDDWKRSKKVEQWRCLQAVSKSDPLWLPVPLSPERVGAASGWRPLFTSELENPPLDTEFITPGGIGWATNNRRPVMNRSDRVFRTRFSCTDTVPAIHNPQRVAEPMEGFRFIYEPELMLLQKCPDLLVWDRIINRWSSTKYVSTLNAATTYCVRAGVTPDYRHRPDGCDPLPGTRFITRAELKSMPLTAYVMGCMGWELRSADQYPHTGSEGLTYCTPAPPPPELAAMERFWKSIAESAK